MRAVTRVLIGSAALALAVTACGGSGGGSGGGGGGENQTKSFSYSIAEPADLIPGGTNESEGAAVDSVLFTALTGYDDKTGASVNLVADSVTSDDQKNWTITLKDGWTFHNGEPLTAESYVGAWNATVYNAWNNTYFFTDLLSVKGAAKVSKKKAKEMSGLEVVDDHTIKVSLTAANPDFPLIIGYNAFNPMPESVLKSKDFKAYKEAPIGNGPYKMDGKWEHNQSITVDKYDKYAGETSGNADQIVFKIYSNPDTAYNDVTAGNLDIAGVPPSRMSSAEGDFQDRFVSADSSSFTYLGLPLWDKAYQDKRVRQAISMAIDRQVIIDQIFAGAFTPAGSLITPLIKLGHRDDPCGDLCKYNPDRAKQLMQEAGGFKGGTVTLWYNTGAGHEQWLQPIANQLKKNLGLNVKLKGQEWNQYLDTINNHKQTGPYRLGWIMDYPGPNDYLGPIYGTNGSSNGSGYSNKKVDQLLAKGQAQDSAEAAVPYYHQAEDIILKDMPIIPLWYGKNQLVHTSKVTNLSFDATAALKLADVQVTG